MLVTGKKGSGKTTHYLKLVTDHRAKWKFLFDPSREAARKLNCRVCIDEPSLVQCVIDCRTVCFDSTALFPGNRHEGFAWFSRQVMTLCKRLRGVKLLAVDELQSCQRIGEHGLPSGFKEICDEGRREEIDCIFAAQRINEVNDDVRGHLTEIVTFRHNDPLPLRWLSERGFDPQAVAALPSPGGWIRITDDGRTTTNARRTSHTQPA